MGNNGEYEFCINKKKVINTIRIPNIPKDKREEVINESEFLNSFLTFPNCVAVFVPKPGLPKNNCK